MPRSPFAKLLGRIFGACGVEFNLDVWKVQDSDKEVATPVKTKISSNSSYTIGVQTNFTSWSAEASAARPCSLSRKTPLTGVHIPLQRSRSRTKPLSSRSSYIKWSCTCFALRSYCLSSQTSMDSCIRLFVYILQRCASLSMQPVQSARLHRLHE